MKRLVKAATDAQINKVKKYVRALVHDVWTSDSSGRLVKYFNDPDMLGNKLRAEYDEISPNVSFQEWIYNQREMNSSKTTFTITL